MPITPKADDRVAVIAGSAFPERIDATSRGGTGNLRSSATLFKSGEELGVCCVGYPRESEWASDFHSALMPVSVLAGAVRLVDASLTPFGSGSLGCWA
jgi:hypothetical protein